MRTIKFRAWDKKEKKMFDVYAIDWGAKQVIVSCHSDSKKYYPNDEMGDQIVFMQFTGLKDKKGKEIYEFMELDNKWEVDWLSGKYILRDISSGDIIDLDYENKYEITREYTKI